MKKYNIILDKTIEFSEKEQLFIMIVFDSKELFLEINDRHSLLFRKFINPKANYIGIHSFVFRKLSVLKNYQSCRAIAQFAFNQSLLTESLFLIDLISRREITWDKILKLQELHKFHVKFEFDNSKTESRHELKTVSVKFNGNDKNLGKFIKKKSSEEFQFIKNPD